MKKLLFILFISLISLSAFAQPTLTSGNYTPSIGETYTYYVADSLANPGGNGAGVTWNFSTLKGYAVPQEVTYIVNPALTPQGPTYFGTSQFADTTAGKNITYYIANATTVNNKGYVFVNTLTGSAVIEWNVNDEKIMEFPFTYNSSFNDNFSGTIHYSILGNPLTDPISGTVNVNADGHGTLMLPFSVTLNNVLRVVTTENASANITGFGNVEISSTIYSFYEPTTSKYPILRIVNSTLNGTQTNMAHCLYPLNPGASITENTIINNINLFPNPSNNNAQLSFYSSEAVNTKIIIRDLVGKDVLNIFNGKLNIGANNFLLKTENLNSGIYLINIENSLSNSTIKFVVE
jgi:hypothetical protein